MAEVHTIKTRQDIWKILWEVGFRLKLLI